LNYVWLRLKLSKGRFSLSSNIQSNSIADSLISVVAILTVYLTINLPQNKLGEIIVCHAHDPRPQCVILAKSLVKDFDGEGKCLLIHHPISKVERKDLETQIKYFREGFGDTVSEIRPIPIKDLHLDSEIYSEEALFDLSADDFNKVLRENSDCDIVITMVALPNSEDELYKMDCFTMIADPSKPANWIKDPKLNYPRLGIHNGYMGKLEALFLDGLIHSMSLWRPDPELKQTREELKKLPIQEQFDLRYLLIEKDNLEEIKSKYPKLFPKRN